MKTGEEIKKWREAHGYSMKKLADRLISPNTKQPPHLSTIGLWEKGKSPVPQWAREQIEQLASSQIAQAVKVKAEATPKQTLQMTKSEGCIVIEFGPEAKAFLGALIRAIEDMIRKATFEIQLSIGPADPMMRLRREEVKEDIQRGEEYRRKTQDILSRGN